MMDTEVWPRPIALCAAWAGQSFPATNPFSDSNWRYILLGRALSLRMITPVGAWTRVRLDHSSCRAAGRALGGGGYFADTAVRLVGHRLPGVSELLDELLLWITNGRAEVVRILGRRVVRPPRRRERRKQEGRDA